MPYTLPNSLYFVQNQPTIEYIAFSEDRKLYFLANSFDHCRRHHNLFVCPPLGPVYDASVDTCESAKFFGKHEATTLCEPYVLKHFPPNFIKGDR